jgi:hypothetical protein
MSPGRSGSATRRWGTGSARRGRPTPLYATLLPRGRRLRRPTEDIHQLGADAVIGRDGTLRYVALLVHPDARPPIGDLIAALD